MDNEAIVDKIVRSLSFHLVAVPQNVTQVDSTSKSTPLNVKIRVRRRAELRHGLLSVPKVEIKNDKINPEWVRLVSSDQTIMDFNILMEADLDKRQLKQNTNIVSPGSKVNNEDNSNFNNAPILLKRNRDIFGRCKPGGCLDPPFSEDKYSYLPVQQILPLPPKEETAKLRSSFIFKNNIFNRKKSTSQCDDHFKVSDSNNKNEIESTSKMNLNGKDPLKLSSSCFTRNSIITYPHPSVSELHKPEEKKIRREEEQTDRKIYSGDVTSKTSSIDDGGYFMIPKKSKKSSIQNDFNKMQNNYAKVGESYNLKVMQLRSNIDPEKIEDNKGDESNLTPQTQAFIPIPLPVPIGIQGDIPPTNNILGDKIKTEDLSEIMTICDEINQNIEKKNLLLLKSETPNYSDSSSDAKNSSDIINKNIQTLKNNEPLGTSVSVFVEDVKRHSNNALNEDQYIIDQFSNKQETHNDALLNGENKLSLKDDLNNSDIPDGKTNLINKTEPKSHPIADAKTNFINKTEPKSNPLLPDRREMSLLDITDGAIDQLKENSTQNQIEISYLNKEIYQNTSSLELNHIWKNETEALISKADVIITKTMQETKKSAGNNHDQPNAYMKQKEIQVLRDIISEADSHTSSARIKNSTENMTKKEFFDNIEENLVEKVNVFGDNKSSVSSPEILQEKFIKTKDEIEKYGFKTHSDENIKDEIVKLKSDIFDSFEQNSYEQINKNKTVNIMNTDDLNKNTADHIDGYDKLSNKNDNLDHSGTGSKGDILKETLFKQTLSFSEKEKREIKTQSEIIIDTDEPTFGLDKSYLNNLPENFTIDEASLPTSILRTGIAPCKIDIALQSYVDENNERIIKSFDSKNIPEKHPNDAFLIARCYMGTGLNEIKIPIDLENDLSIIVATVHPQHQPRVEFNDIASSADILLGKRKYSRDVSDKFQQQPQADNMYESSKIFDEYAKKIMKIDPQRDGRNVSDGYGEKKIKIDAPVSDSDLTDGYTDYDQLNIAEADMYNKTIMSGDLRTALNSIYEEGLVPLQGIIKGLREDIDALLAYQMKLKVHNFASNRMRLQKLGHPKKCSCLKRL